MKGTQLTLDIPSKIDTTAKYLWIKTKNLGERPWKWTGHICRIIRYKNIGNGMWEDRLDTKHPITTQELEKMVNTQQCIVSLVPMFDANVFDFETDNDPARIDWIPDDSDVFYAKIYYPPAPRNYHEIIRYTRQPNGEWLSSGLQPNGTWKTGKTFSEDWLERLLSYGFIRTLREMKDTAHYNTL